MKKLITILAFVLFLVPSITLAATYEVEVTAADRLVYQKKKAKAALSVAYKCWLRGDQEFYLKNLQCSRSLYKYSFFSDCGLLQRVPFLFQVLKFFGKIKKG